MSEPVNELPAVTGIVVEDAEPAAPPAPEPVAPSLATTAFDMPPDVAHKPPAAMGEATKLLSDPAQAPAPQPKPVATHFSCKSSGPCSG